MKKSVLITEVAKKTGISREETELVINTLLDSIVDSLKNKEAVSFLGFGTFEPVVKNAREIYIPGTTTKVQVAQKNGVRFKPGKTLKKAIQEES